jgi:hypothetical protein
MEGRVSRSRASPLRPGGRKYSEESSAERPRGDGRRSQATLMNERAAARADPLIRGKR